jgi:hypothetical protein
MQKGYENVTGWLGIMMGDKIFINFMKYEFSECVRRLKAEIDQHYKAAKQSHGESIIAGSQLAYFKSSKTDSIQSWSAEKISELFANKVNLNQGLGLYQGSRWTFCSAN